MISPFWVLCVVVCYFMLLFIIAQVTTKTSDNNSFFNAKKSSPWYVVAFGMIGASLSGVTFLSIPGAVGNASMSYMQMVFGYLLGYVVIANLLMPLYYKLNLTSIYTYLQGRFGNATYKTGASYFLLSRIVGASFRLFLVAMVFHKFILVHYGIPFWVTVILTVLLIWIYTFKGGIKTIVWTDTLQTLFMLLAVVITIVFILQELNWTPTQAVTQIAESSYGNIFVWDSTQPNYFWKHFLGGMFITIVMTGLDQDMMQKNLTCKNIKEAKKNVYWMSAALVPVNLLFLALGALLYLYGQQKGFLIENFGNASLMDLNQHLTLTNANGETDFYKKDELFPFLSFSYLPIFAAFTFIVGLTAAAYSSADSALTSLTTSFYIDILGKEKDQEKKDVRTRMYIHVGFSLVLVLVILLFAAINSDSVINELFKIAGYTYGPLLGFYAFGMFTKINVRDKWVPVIALLSPLISYIIATNSTNWWGYTFGFELLILNGCITFIGLLLLKTKTSALAK